MQRLELYHTVAAYFTRNTLFEVFVWNLLIRKMTYQLMSCFIISVKVICFLNAVCVFTYIYECQACHALGESVL